MFNNILIPISSEFYRKEILKIGVFLAERFNSKVTLVYIIEEKTLDQADKLSDAYRTHYDKQEMKKEIISRYVRTADKIIFNDADLLFKAKNISIEEEVIEGEFSTVVNGVLKKKKYDLIIMGFDKECLLEYRLFDEVNIPIWVESGYEITSMLAVCSNLAPNQKVPEVSVNLSEIFGWKLHMVYVVDIQDAVEVDVMGRRSGRKSEEELVNKGKYFVSEMEKKGFDVSLVKGSLEKETVRAAEKIGAELVIIGREQKKKSLLGLSAKSVKRKMAEKCRYSMLFIN